MPDQDADRSADQDVELDPWSPQGPVTQLSAENCWATLAASSYGRLAVSDGGQPVIFPVHHLCDGETIVFRTARGAKLESLLANPRVAFETDAQSLTESSSVVITGTAAVVNDGREIARLDALALPVWAPTRRYVFVRITPTSVQGRRITTGLDAGRLTP